MMEAILLLSPHGLGNRTSNQITLSKGTA